jgi:pantoate--beta-alanine ligase
MSQIALVHTPKELRALLARARGEGKTIGFVPTMGYLHEGHLSLMRIAAQRSDLVCISIFVNPTQFGPTEDLDRYPRDLHGDLSKAVHCGVDVCYAPSKHTVYPPGFQTYVAVEALSRPLCGAKRPGHFRGVATVVAKLFNLVQPDCAVFGKKDFQQLAVIRRMVRDLDMGVEIVGAPIVRENDGLAMSSRNAYLTTRQRRQATCLYRSLERAKTLFGRGERDTLKLVSAVRTLIEAEPEARVDYIEIRDPETLEPLERIVDRGLVALAVFFGKTRLIDNTVLEQ